MLELFGKAGSMLDHDMNNTEFASVHEDFGFGRPAVILGLLHLF